MGSSWVPCALWEMDLWLVFHWKECDRGDSFSFDFSFWFQFLLNQPTSRNCKCDLISVDLTRSRSGFLRESESMRSSCPCMDFCSRGYFLSVATFVSPFGWNFCNDQPRGWRFIKIKLLEHYGQYSTLYNILLIFYNSAGRIAFEG